MSGCCDDSTCAWRENGGTCDTCKVKATHIKDGCNCIFKMSKAKFERWTKKQSEIKVTEKTSCGCGG